MELNQKNISTRKLAKIVKEKATKEEVKELLVDMIATLTIVKPSHNHIVNESFQLVENLYEKYEELKIEVGKSYLTRDERIIKILANTNHDIFPFIGLLEGTNQTFSFTREGRFHSNKGNEFDSDLDLIKEVAQSDE